MDPPHDAPPPKNLWIRHSQCRLYIIAELVMRASGENYGARFVLRQKFEPVSRNKVSPEGILYFYPRLVKLQPIDKKLQTKGAVHKVRHAIFDQF